MILLVAENVKENSRLILILTVEIPYELNYNLCDNEINESFYKYNYHNQFREFGISKREMLKTVGVKRKK